MRDISKSGPRLTTLPNGLRIVQEPMAQARSVSLGIWVGTGTRAEPKEMNGVAHFLEHMAFKGTQRRSARAIAEEIEAVGGHLNAYTARENTAYYAKVLADDLPLALDIIADIVQNPIFDPEELERERGVILQEIGQCFDTPDDIIYDHFQETAFPDQPMGRPVLGTVDTVAPMSRDAVRGFMRERYNADSMVLGVAGAIDPALVDDLAAKTFERMAPAAQHDMASASYKGGEYREDRDSEQVHMLMGFEGPSYGSSDYYTAGVLSALLGGGMSSRLFQSIREKRGLVYSIYAFAWTFADTGLFGVYAGTGQNDVAELVAVLCDEIVGLADSLTDEEILRAKAQITASLLMSRESTGGLVDQLGNQVLVHGAPISEADQLARIESVDRHALAAMARRIFATPPTLAALGPLSQLESYDRIADRLKV